MTQDTTLVCYTCRRVTKFIEMINSVHKMVLDKHRIARIVISDDNTQPEGLVEMLRATEALFGQPIILHHRINERGLEHTWSAGWREATTRFVLNMEDDWQFTEPGHYIEYGQAVMEIDHNIAEVCFAYHAPGSHYLPYEAEEIHCAMGEVKYLRWPEGHHWFGYTNNPNLIHMSRVRERMADPYPSEKNYAAEWEFGKRFKAAGLRVAFLPKAVVKHTGDISAFDLNSTREPR